MIRAKVDDDLCCGCGPCEEICPEVFYIDGIARVLVDIVPLESEAKCRQAADACPTGAITIETVSEERVERGT